MAENPRQDLFLDISQNLLDEQLQDLRNYISGAKILPAKFVQKADAHQIFNQLENEQKLKLGDLSLLAKILRKIGRHDYAEQAEELAEKERKDSSSEQSDSACKRRRLDTTETKETQEQANALRSAVSTLYKNTLNMLKPLPWDPRFSLDLDAVFTSLELVSLHGLQDRGNLASLDGVFDHQKKNDQDKRFNVLVVGDAGGGKSTLLSKTALDWSCGKGRLAEMNKIVLLVRLREVQPGESIARIIWDQCVTQSEDISVASIETCLRENEPKLVFQLDGYDELVPGACESKETIPKLLAKKLYPRSTVIVTSRPFTGVEQYMKVNCEMKVMGFSPRNVEKYVTTYFNTVEKPGLADSLVKALQANIVARSLIQTPMFLMLICVLWEDDPTRVFPGTMSGLYQELLACVVRKFCVREDLPMPNDEFPSMVSTALLRLGKLALESFLRGESLVDLGNTPTILDTDILLKLGIVSKEVSASRLHPREQLNFPHKTMQEFLAGRYVADTVKTSSGHLHELVPLDSQDKLQWQSNLVQFICGCGGKATREMLAQFNKLHVCEAVSESEPESEPDNADNTSLKDLCMMSLYEGQDPRYFPIVSTLLSSLDLTINVPSKQGAALKYCLNHAPAVPEGRSLKLAVKEASKGDAVEYLSCLVEKHMPDVQLYFELFLRHCYIGNKLCKLIPLLQNVPHVQTLNLRKTGLTPESLQSLGGILPKLVKLERLDLSGNENIGDTDMRVPSEEFKIDLTFLTLRKSGLGDVFVKSLAAMLHHLHHLVFIDLSHNKIGLAGLEPFSVLEHPVARLKKVSLYDNNIGDVCMRSLASVLHHLSCLENLNLSYNNIGSEGMEPFAAILHPVASLKVLSLSRNKIGDVCMRSLASVLHHLSFLENLKLPHNNIGSEGMEPFAAIKQPVASLEVLTLSYNKIGDVCMRSLAAVLHHLPCLEDLDLSYNNIGDEGLEPFASIKQPVASLKVLSLSHNKIGDVCMRSLAAVLHHLSCLEDLNLSHNNIGSEGMEPFTAIEQPVASLKVLKLNENKIGDVCMRSLAAVLHHLPCLEDLDLTYNKIGDEELEPFAALEHPVASLEVLDLSNNKIGDVCMRSLASVMHHLSCVVLNLSNNNIGDEGLEPFAAIQHPVASLKVLKLYVNKIGDVCMRSLAAVLHHLPCLEMLDLSYNNIGNEELEPFAAIQQPIASLMVLNLCNNNIGDVCMRSLASVMHHLSCVVLNLSHNNIGDEGMEPFAAIQHPVASLKVLDLSNNKIGDVCMRSLASVMHHLSCVEGLNLSHNNIGDEGLEPFAAIRQPVASLKVLTLELSYNKIGDVCMRSLASVLHHLYCLKELDLSQNNIGGTELASFAASLRYVPSLQYITLCNNPITEMSIKDFAQTIPLMPALKQLALVPYETAHLDETGSTSIATMLTRLPALECLSLENISMQAAGFMDMVRAVEGRAMEFMDFMLYYSWHLVPLEDESACRSSNINLCKEDSEDDYYDDYHNDDVVEYDHDETSSDSDDGFWGW